MSQSIGQKYDRIAGWWNDHHQNSEYGVAAFEKALGFVGTGRRALDIGCGSGGRFIHRLADRGFHVTGIDASKAMIDIARANHPEMKFIANDIQHWSDMGRFDFIYAWDSLFHLPLEAQAPVLRKTCQSLSSEGVLFYSFGAGKPGAHDDVWHAMTFSYSTLGINENLRILMEEGLEVQHLELDQFPEKHAYIIARKGVK